MDSTTISLGEHHPNQKPKSLGKTHAPAEVCPLRHDQRLGALAADGDWIGGFCIENGGS